MYFQTIFSVKQLKVITMRNQFPAGQIQKNDSSRMRSESEMQRRFVELQFKRSELERELKRINEVLSSLGKDMEEQLAYDQFYK